MGTVRVESGIITKTFCFREEEKREQETSSLYFSEERALWASPFSNKIIPFFLLLPDSMKNTFPVYSAVSVSTKKVSLGLSEVGWQPLPFPAIKIGKRGRKSGTGISRRARVQACRKDGKQSLTFSRNKGEVKSKPGSSLSAS